MLHEPVDLGSGRRLPGGILAQALPLPDGWENGIGFLGTGCQEPEIVIPCAVVDRTEIRPGEGVFFEPIFVNQSSACSTLSKLGHTDIAADRLESTTEWALGRLLATGVGTTNPTLADADLVSASAEAVDAMSCLEQAIADVGFGADAVIHVPFRAAAYLRQQYLISDSGLSPAGIPIIISPGYPVDDDESVSLWATGPVFAGVTAAYLLVDGVTGLPPMKWRQNTDAAYQQRLALAAFDPCLNLTVTFTVPACTGGS
jgi:hypothetical protein